MTTRPAGALFARPPPSAAVILALPRQLLHEQRDKISVIPFLLGTLRAMHQRRSEAFVDGLHIQAIGIDASIEVDHCAHD